MNELVGMYTLHIELLVGVVGLDGARLGSCTWVVLTLKSAANEKGSLIDQYLVESCSACTDIRRLLHHLLVETLSQLES